ncbi:hypothetical protein GCM10023168_02700 [Fodinibacter luteus]|uniref:Uncharacterized protein n=1 Tax=Fodinibacter luteus TaxID=552064 RepID=A0ABP8JXM0_9MICO
MHTHLRLLAVLAVVTLATACGTSPGGSDETTGSPGPGTAVPSASGSVAPSASGSATEASPGGGPTGAAPVPSGLREQPRVVAAIEDTAAREDVPVDEVVIAAWSPVTWNDGSMGCPQEGMSYTQATIEGELLILRVDGGLFQYHARTGGPFMYCASPSAGYRVGG